MMVTRTQHAANDRSSGWPRTMGRPGGRPGSRRWLSLAVIALAALGFVLAMESEPQAAGAGPEPVSTGDASEWTPSTPTASNAEADFSKFAHNSGAHSRLPCATCHRRDNTAPQSTRPGHRPCAGCHSQKFAALGGPICTICHTTAEPKSAVMKPPPSLKTFGVRFDHSRHSGAACTSCHKPAARGVTVTIPSGAGAHTTCYQCHGAGTPTAVQAGGKDISSCSTCHVPGRTAPLAAAARGYPVNFSHALHGAKGRLSCAECHRIRGGTGRDQVSEPQLLMHHATAGSPSCAACHNDKRAFGTDTFADCKRCHTGPTFRFK